MSAMRHVQSLKGAFGESPHYAVQGERRLPYEPPTVTELSPEDPRAQALAASLEAEVPPPEVKVE